SYPIALTSRSYWPTPKSVKYASDLSAVVCHTAVCVFLFSSLMTDCRSSGTRLSSKTLSARTAPVDSYVLVPAVGAPAVAKASELRDLATACKLRRRTKAHQKRGFMTNSQPSDGKKCLILHV